MGEHKHSVVSLVLETLKESVPNNIANYTLKEKVIEKVIKNAVNSVTDCNIRVAISTLRKHGHRIAGRGVYRYKGGNNEVY